MYILFVQCNVRVTNTLGLSSVCNSDFLLCMYIGSCCRSSVVSYRTPPSSPGMLKPWVPFRHINTGCHRYTSPRCVGPNLPTPAAMLLPSYPPSLLQPFLPSLLMYPRKCHSCPVGYCCQLLRQYVHTSC